MSTRLASSVADSAVVEAKRPRVAPVAVPEQVQYDDFAVPMTHLKTLLQPMLGPLLRGPVRWGRLIPVGRDDEPADLSGACFTVGRSAECSLPQFEGEAGTQVICRLVFNGGSPYLETLTSSAEVQLGSAPLKKGAKTPLVDGGTLQVRSGGRCASWLVELAPRAVAADLQPVLEYVQKAADAVVAAASLHSTLRAPTPRASTAPPAAAPVNEAPLEFEEFEEFEDAVGAEMEEFVHPDLRGALEATAYPRLFAPEKLRALGPGRVLLTGPAGTRGYQLKLVRSLAAGLGARLLACRVCPSEPEGCHKTTTTTLREGDRVRFVGGPNAAPVLVGRQSADGPIVAALEPLQRGGPRLGAVGTVASRGKVAFDGAGAAVAVPAAHLRPLERDLGVDKVVEAAVDRPTIVFLRDVDAAVTTHRGLLRVLALLSALEASRQPVLVVAGSETHPHGDERVALPSAPAEQARVKQQLRMSRLLRLLDAPALPIVEPSPVTAEWRAMLAGDAEQLRREGNSAALAAALARAGLRGHHAAAVALVPSLTLSAADADRVVSWAAAQQMRASGPSSLAQGLQAAALEHALRLLQGLASGGAPGTAVACDNEHERQLLHEAVVPAGEIGVPFSDVGSLEATKAALKELVMLPLQRPELFTSSLSAPCKGVLLFGPPGTGKTMLAKAVATEAGASFLSVTLSSVASRWFGEAEKYVRAVFSLARKMQPCVIFVDEVDALLSRRGGGGGGGGGGGSNNNTQNDSATRKLKNEFMTHWDGLRTARDERVLVLAATNRPFDLDDAVLRRFPRRMLVDLPDAAARERILSVLLQREPLATDLDIGRVASDSLSGGFSGCDLKNLCAAAAYARIREYTAAEVPGAPVALPPLAMAHFVAGRREVCASSDAGSREELRRWAEAFGDGGRGQHSSAELSYFT